MEVPVQYFQSVIAIELAIAGALLFEIRFFTPRQIAVSTERRPAYRFQLLFAVVLGATLFGSLAAMLHAGDRGAATAVTVGVSVSLLPILLRVLPPLGRQADSTERHSDFAITVVGLVLYVAVTAGAVALVIL